MKYFLTILIIILGAICPIHIIASEEHNFFFENYSVDNGMSDRVVYSIAQDADGYLWFGTENGLNRFDGYSFKVYRHLNDDANSLSNSTVNCLLNDSEGNLWIGTDEGLNIYNAQKGTFSIPQAENDTTKLLASMRIRTLYQDEQGTIWVGTQNGLLRYDTNYKIVTRHSFRGIATSDNRNIIRGISPAPNNALWISTFDGVFHFTPSTGEIVFHNPRNPRPNDPKNNLVQPCYQDPKDPNILWVGAETGLYKYNTSNKLFVEFRHDTQPNSLSNSVIKCIVPYDEQHFLIGTDAGLNLFNTQNQTFKVFKHKPNDRLSICNDAVWDIFKDSSGNTWFATNNGVAKINTYHSALSVYDVNESSEQEEIIQGIHTDSQGNRWVVSQNKISSISAASGVRNDYQFQHNAAQLIRLIAIDKYDVVWAGTTNGLWYKNKNSHTFYKAPLSNDDNTLRYIFDIAQDADANLWINAYSGLCKIVPTRTANGDVASITHSTYYIENTMDNGNIEISSISIGSKGHIWCNGKNGNLFVFDPKREEFMTTAANQIRQLIAVEGDNAHLLTESGVYTYHISTRTFTKIPLPHTSVSTVQAALSDGKGNLWLTTFHCLLQINLSTQRITKHNLSSCLDNSGFVANALNISPDGLLWIGAYNKYISFDPARIAQHSTDSPLKITNFYAMNREVNWEHNTQNEPDRVELDHTDNFFQITFSLLNYQAVESNQYSYQLEGVDKKWMTTTGSNNQATYSNLSPGRYIFKLKAASTDGNWTAQPTLLHITIRSPWWRSPLACVCYSVLLLVVLYLVFRLVKKQFNLSQSVKRERQEVENDKIITQHKLRFFTNISHEFRTPLTLIIAPIESLLEQITDSAQLIQLGIMKSNAERLLRLVNQIMDFRKIENKQMDVNLQVGDFVEFIRKIHTMFADDAQRKNINYQLELKVDKYVTLFDHDKIEKVLYNLLSNAFKFTPDGGFIEIRIAKIGDNNIEFAVSDSGIGIAETEQELIFDRFYQSKLNNEQGTGTGIGLALSKDFVELHDGTVTVRSSKGEGSTFVVKLPLQETSESIHVDTTHHVENEPEQSETNERATLLIVDDNEEMREYLKLTLEKEYNILLAADGKQGLEKVLAHTPDIIVSDLMMPVMDGLEFCRRVKSDIAVNHIPFILLTAKSGDKNMYEGLRTGADEYIEKPFNIRLLKLRLEKIIENRQKMQSYFQDASPEAEVDIEEIWRKDQFIASVIEYIEQEISNEEVGIKDLCEKLKLPHQTVYRKMKAITGLTISEFIRSIRLKHAARMLVESSENITEIMYAVGFSNRSYFSKCFSEKYNLTPKEYRKEHSPLLN